MAKPLEIRAEEIRIGDRWHINRYDHNGQPAGCDLTEELSVRDIQRDPGDRVRIILAGASPHGMVYGARTWVLVHQRTRLWTPPIPPPPL